MPCSLYTTRNSSSGEKFSSASMAPEGRRCGAGYSSRMSQYFELHPRNPQLRLLRQAAEILRRGGLIAYPTDSCYALGCHIGDKAALERLRRLRGADRHHHFTLVCRDMAELSRFARLETWQFRLIKSATP